MNMSCNPQMTLYDIIIISSAEREEKKTLTEFRSVQKIHKKPHDTLNDLLLDWSSSCKCFGDGENDSGWSEAFWVTR